MLGSSERGNKKALGQSLSHKKNQTELVKALATTEENKNKCGGRFLHFVRSQDVFGEKVQFTFKGKKTYQTVVGAIASIIIKLILAFFIAYEFYVIFARKHPAIAVKEEIAEEHKKIEPFQLGFNMAF